MSENGFKFNRVWAIASAETFTIPPIRQLVKYYLSQSKVSVDPFARNNQWATHTNDLNPDTAAKSHLTALEFLSGMAGRSEKADLVLFDPPYSRRQVMECYQGIGKDFQNADSQYFTVNWRDERKAIDDLLEENGVVMSFGWHTNGMQQSGNYKIEHILLVAHGGAHNDTIVTVERKVADPQNGLFS